MSKPRWPLPKIHNLPQCIYICWWNSEYFIDKDNWDWWVRQNRNFIGANIEIINITKKGGHTYFNL